MVLTMLMVNSRVWGRDFPIDIMAGACPDSWLHCLENGAGAAMQKDPVQEFDWAGSR